jgi:formylglycine-generating enzyme required for sulfatase activity
VRFASLIFLLALGANIGRGQAAAFVAKFAAENGLPMVQIAPGEFTMGDRDDGPPHSVTISRPFFLGATNVTQAQWTAVMGYNPSSFKGDTLPVESVSWDDAISYCKKLTERERAAGRLPPGWEFTLPTEAQWEYACRAGTTGDFAGDLDAMAWYAKNSGGTPHPVGTKQPNAWGLYDMHGNVAEWCADWYDSYPSGSITDPAGPASGALRVNRGGSWLVTEEFCRSAARWRNPHQFRDHFLGFRLALSSSRSIQTP